MDEATLSRIEDLIELAVTSGSASIKGRHAAFQACKMIADNGVVLAVDAPKGVCRRCKGSTAPSESALTLLDKGVRDIKMQFSGTCLSCKEVVSVGACSYWKKGTGVTHHGECVNFWFT